MFNGKVYFKDGVWNKEYMHNHAYPPDSPYRKRSSWAYMGGRSSYVDNERLWIEPTGQSLYAVLESGKEYRVGELKLNGAT